MAVETLEIHESPYHSAATLAKARTLYVVKGLARSDVAQKVGVPAGTVSTWIARGGWFAEREKRLAKLESQALAHAQDDHSAFLASVSSQVEELAEDSLSVAREAIAEGLSGTRELQQASQSAKNFVDIYFKANRLDAAQGAINIKAENLIFRLPSEEPKNVTPIEQSAEIKEIT